MRRHLAVIASMCLSACGGGKDKSKSGENADAPPVEDENTKTTAPIEVAGSFLVDCAWGEKIDEEHAQVGCGAREAAAGTFKWQAVGADGKELTLEQIPVPSDAAGVQAVFKMPLGVVLEASVASERIEAGKKYIASVVLKDELAGLRDDATVACLKKGASIACIKGALGTLGDFKTAVDFVNRFSRTPLPAGEPLATLALDAYVTPVSEGFERLVMAAGLDNFCGDEGIRTGTKSDALAPRTKARFTLANLADKRTCFYPFTNGSTVTSALSKDAYLFGPRLLGGPKKVDLDVPVCFFVMVKGFAGVGDDGKERAETEPRLYLIENPAVVTGVTNVPGFNASNLLATVDAYRCKLD